MANVVSIAGSPSAISCTRALLRHIEVDLACRGHDVVQVDVRSLPAEALLGADPRHPAISRVADLLAQADGVVVGTPVYKAAYSGLLKSLLDLLPQHALAGKVVLPLATGGTTAHVLAIDYALRPVLTSMGATQVTPGRFTLDREITVREDGSVLIAEETVAALEPVTEQFSAALDAAVHLATAALVAAPAR